MMTRSPASLILARDASIEISHLLSPIRLANTKLILASHSVMSSENSSSTDAQNALKAGEKTVEKRSQQSPVNVLEEDDEFEEFEVQGGRSFVPSTDSCLSLCYLTARNLLFTMSTLHC